MIEKDDAKQNRVVKRALHILYIIDKYGRNSPMLTNYISDCSIHSKERSNTMSADNGIYILETYSTRKPISSEEYEYRVRELQAIENVEFDKDAPEAIYPTDKYHSVYEFRPEDKEHQDYQKAYNKRYHSDNPNVQISNARNMWGKECKVFSDKSSALLYAAELLDKCTKEYGFEPKYGISFIKIPRVF